MLDGGRLHWSLSPASVVAPADDDEPRASRGRLFALPYPERLDFSRLGSSSQPLARMRSRRPHAEEPMAVALRAGDGEGDSGPARIGYAVPHESVVDDGHPFEPALPLSDQQRPRLQDQRLAGRTADETLDSAASSEPGGADPLAADLFIVRQSLQHPDGSPIKIAESLGLKAIGHDAKKTSREMGRRKPEPALVQTCRAASTASAITACSQERFERATSNAPAKRSPRPRPRPSARPPRPTARLKAFRLRGVARVAAAA